MRRHDAYDVIVNDNRDTIPTKALTSSQEAGSDDDANFVRGFSEDIKGVTCYTCCSSWKCWTHMPWLSHWPVGDRREVGTRFASLIFANMRLANLVSTSRRSGTNTIVTQTHHWGREVSWVLPVNVTSPLTISQHWFSNGLVSSGNKPLPEPMLTKFHDAMWCHVATMG